MYYVVRTLLILVAIIVVICYLAFPSSEPEVCDVLAQGTGKYHAGKLLAVNEFIEFSVPLANTSEKPVSVHVNQVSCSCIRFPQETLTINAGKTHLLPLKINVNSKYGQNQISLSLDINSQLSKAIIITYLVTRNFEWDRPESVPGFPMQANHHIQRTLMVNKQFHQGKPIHLNCANPEVKIERFREVGENGDFRRYLVDLAYLPHLQEGSYQATFAITNDTNKAEFSFPYHVINMYTCTPVATYLSNQAVPTYIVLKRIDGKPFAIDSISQARGITTQPATSPTAKSHRIVLMVDKNVPFSERRETIQIMTDAPDQSSVQFPCYFVNQESVTKPER